MVESNAYPDAHILHLVLSVSLHKLHPVNVHGTQIFWAELVEFVIRESRFCLSHCVHTPEVSQAVHPYVGHTVQTPLLT